MSFDEALTFGEAIILTLVIIVAMFVSKRF